MFKQYYQRLNIALPKFLTALLIGILFQPVSGIATKAFLPNSNAAVTATATSTNTNLWVDAADSAAAVANLATRGWLSVTPSSIDDGYSEILSSGQTCSLSASYCATLNTNWSFNFAGKTYSKVFFSSNGYITFNNGSGTIPGSISSIFQPGLMLCGADRYVSRQLYLVDAQGNLHLRMEGYDFQSNFSTTPQIYEITLVNGTSEMRVAVGKFIQGSGRPCVYPTAPTLPTGSNSAVGLMNTDTPTTTANSLLQTFPTGKDIQWTSTIFTTSNGPALVSSLGTTVSTNAGVTIFDTITASGGTGTTRLTMNAANRGVTFETSTGVGVVRIETTTVGSFTQTFTGTDSTNATTSLTVTFVVNPLPTNTRSSPTLTTTLGRVGSETMTVSGGTGTKTFIKTSSFPQSGITLDTSSASSGIAVLKVAATGVVAGTTTETVTCTDAVGSVTVAVFTVIVNPAMSLTNTRGYTVPVTVGGALSETITVTGGTGSKTFTRTTSSNSAISIDTSTASSNYILLKATSSLPAGTYFETITVTDSRSATSSLGLKIVATAAMVIGGGSSSSLSTSAGTTTFETKTVTGGSVPITFTVTSSPANSGITISSSSNTQVVVRVASSVAVGSYTLSLTGTDTASATTTHTINLTVASPLKWSNSNPTVLNSTLGNAASLQLDFVNGGSGKTFTLSQSALMTNPGITLDTSTIVSNYVKLQVARTVGPGTYIVTVTGRDATGTQVSSVIAVTVNQPLSMTRNNNLVAIGLGTQKFNGTGQHLSLPAGSGWAIGGTWTLEWWQYETGTATEKSIIKMAGNAFGVGITATSLYLYNNSSFTTLTSSLVEADRKNKWTHFAIVSDSGTVYAYQNGIRLNATGINFGSVTSTYAPSNYAMCVGTKCSALDGSTGSSTNYFGGYIANLMIHKRIDYTGSSTTDANFTPGYNLNIDSRTVVALALLPGDSVLSDLSNSALTVTQRGNAAVGSTDFPNLTSPDVMVLETTQGKPRFTYGFAASGGTGNKTMTSSADTVGLVTTLGSSALFHSLNESATAINSTTVRSVYETVTATDASGAVLQAKSKLIINPQVALSATTWNLSVPAGVEAYDTITASYGTGSKSISMVGSPSTSAIEVFSNVYGSNPMLVIRVTRNATVGTYYETLTAYDLMSDIETAVVTITVTPGLSLTSASGSTSLTATAGKAASLQLNAENGSGTKTFALTHLGAVSAGITIDTTTVVGAAILKIATSVPAGTYSEKITVTDAQGTSVSITISVTVNQAPTISYTGSTSGAITLTTTAGKALTSGAFTAALGTGTRTLSLSGVNSQVSIDTSTANIGYLILGSGLTATNSTTDKTYYETITVTDSLSATSLRAVTIVVKPAISQTASFLTLNTTAGVSITDTVTASYGTGNKIFSLAISPNVSGISFTNSVTNRAVITVANTLSPGTYTITVTATDSVSATSSIDITLNVASSLSISGSSNITSTAGYAFTSPVYSSTGGSGNTSFTLVSPPTGVSLSASSGSPSILVASTGITAGTYNLTLRATDSVTATTTFAITLVVNPPVTLDGNKTLSKVYGEELTQVYQTNSGTAPYRIFASNICTTEKSTDGSYTVEKFGGTGTCNWNVPTNVSSLEVLTVAGGGGGGGSAWAGGGGAGGVVYVSTYSVTEKQSISVVVGTGGNGGTNDTACNSGLSPSQGSNGGNSSFNSTFTAVGGGGGGGYGWGGRTGCGSGKQGGSGGGSGETDYTPSIATSTQGSFANATSYGNSGGRTTYLSGVQAGSGGGGAGGVGGSTIGSTATARDRIAGAGGAGTSISITGSAVTYGGGGGGATCSSCGSTPEGTIGAGGSGGGGAGGNNASSPGNGTNGLGGGGGGSQTGTGGKGGSGVVIVRYLTPAVDSSTTTLTMTTLTTNPTGSLQLNAPKNLPVGTYTQTITVTDANGSTGSTPVNVVLTVSKATPNLSLSIPGGGTTVTYGSPVTISASSTTAGNFDFKKGGTTISGCGTKATSSGVATCSWTPTDTSTAVISAAFSPSDSGNWNSVTSTNLTLTVSQADTLTVTFGAQDFNYTGSAVSVSRSYTLSGLTSIDSITAVTTLITGTANDSSSYSSNTGPTKAGAYSLTGTAVTFSGSTKASYYKSIVYVPANININRAANVISLRYGSNNIVTYKPTGVETATAGYLGTGAISYSTSSSTYCSVDSSSGDLTTILAGSCDVSLSVGQGSNYLGDTVTATVTINKASRTIAISSSKSSLKYSETATVATTINFDGSDGAISYSVGSTTGCSFDQANNLLTAISGTATCALAATIGEGANYLSATSSTLSFTLSKADAPTLTLIAPANIDYSPSATSSDIPLPTFTLTGLKLDDTATALSNMTITYLASGTYAYNSTTVPTGANVYTITPSILTLSTGDISNYQSPIIVSASWTINQIAQAALLVTSLLQEGITVPYDVQYTGGSTNGTATANIVAGGTATNCSFVGNSLRANSSGSCVIQLSMAGNQNYLAVSSETITVVIANFVQSIFNFDSLASGSTGITITSEVPYTVDVEQCSSECVPTIASISQTTFQGGDQLVITGTDFLGATAVVFNRTVFVTVGNGMQVDDNSQITVVVPMGLTAGAGSISVKNDLKISARLGGLTVTANPLPQIG